MTTSQSLHFCTQHFPHWKLPYPLQTVAKKQLQIFVLSIIFVFKVKDLTDSNLVYSVTNTVSLH